MVDPLSALLQHLVEPFLDPGSRTFWPGLVLAAAIAASAAAWGARSDPRRAARRALRAIAPVRLLLHRSSRLDVQLLAGRQLLAYLGAIPAVASAWWIAFRVVGALDATVGAPAPWSGDLWLPSAAYALTLFVAWDLSRYVLHRLMHEIPLLWAFHQVHHSAEVLTPLTFHRVHPVESVLYGLRGALVTGVVTGAFFWAFRGAASDVTILGVSALGLVGNTLTGNLRHSHVWLRFPAAVERWLLSPAQHQLHHADDPAWYGRNYGTWIAAWDRIGGTLATAPATPPARFGVTDRNHRDHLLSAWFGPFLALGRRALPGATAAAAVLLSATARAEPAGDAPSVSTGAPRRPIPPEAPPPPRADAGYSMVVYGDDGTPRRVAGSAHVIDEAELARFRRTDVHDALTAVPGVYVRTEDGFGLRPNIGMRGANSDRSSKVTLLEDGVLLGPAPYAAPAAYYFPMTARLAGIEVFKGPASTQHGPQTVGGAINVLTRAVPQDGPDARIDFGFGERSTSRLHAWAGAGDARRGVLIEGSTLGTAGFKQLDGGGPTGFVRGDLMLKGRLATDPELSARHALELKLGYGGEDSNETYLGLHPDDFAQTPNRRYAASALDRMRWDRTQAELAWTARFGERLQVRTVAYHHHLQRTWLRLNRFAGGPDLHGLLSRPAGGQGAVYLDILRGAEDAVTDDQLLMLANNDRRFHSGGVQSVARLRSDLGATTSTLEVGVRVHVDHVRRYHTELAHRMTSGALVAEDRPPLVATDSIADVLAVAAHVHETLEARTWALTPGLRVEAIRARLQVVDGPKADATTRIVALPGLGGSARLGPRIHAFAGVYRGFSPVAPGEPGEVRPESSWNTEAGLRAGPLDAPLLELVGFVNDYANLTGQCTFSGGCTGDDVDRQFNGGKALIYGVEAASHGRLDLPAGFTLAIDATYTWTQARFRTGFVSGFPQFGAVEPGFGLPYVPAHQGALSVAAARGRYELAGRAVARTGMRDVAGAGPLDARRDVPPLATLDLSAHAPLTRHVAAWATATNLTNAQPVTAWRPFGARPIAPRLAMVGLTLAARGEDR
jgi:Fe(3+) dicitrate transport protein